MNMSATPIFRTPGGGPAPLRTESSGRTGRGGRRRRGRRERRGRGRERRACGASHVSLRNALFAAEMLLFCSKTLSATFFRNFFPQRFSATFFLNFWRRQGDLAAAGTPARSAGRTPRPKAGLRIVCESQFAKKVANVCQILEGLFSAKSKIGADTTKNEPMFAEKLRANVF